MKLSKKTRTFIELTAYWGNDDAESTLRISPRRWKQIQEGAECTAPAKGFYEGNRFPVQWRFSGGMFSIDGEDGMECVVSRPVTDLIVRDQGTPEDRSAM